MEEITKSQEEILKVLWEIKEGVVSDIIAKLPNPKPAYTTVSTVVRVLEKKKYVSHKAYGKTHVYFPLISKEKYADFTFKDLMKGFFNNSLKQVVSFFGEQNKLSLKELEDIRSHINEEIRKQKK